MSLGPVYRFATKAQWATALSAAIGVELRLDPAEGEALGPVLAGVVTYGLGSDGLLVWLSPDGVLSSGGCGGPALGVVRRLIVDEAAIWVLTAAGAVELDANSLQVLHTVGPAEVRDIAPSSDGGLWLLTGEGLLKADRRGRVAPAGPADLAGDQIAAAGPAVALLDTVAQTVRLWTPGAGPVVQVPLADVLGRDQPGFAAETIAGGGDAFLLTGQRAGAPAFILLDPSGAPAAWGVYDVERIRSLVLAGDDLLALVRDGRRWIVTRFPRAGAGGGRVWLTPALQSDTLAGDWIRADLRAVVPEGAAVTIRLAATADLALKTAADATFHDATRSPADRLAALRLLLASAWVERPVTYPGSATARPELLAMPLDAAQGDIIWLEISLHESATVAGARLDSLDVLHDATSLIENLPAIYRSPSGDARGALRSLVAVLETTSHSLDERIARLAERLDADRTEARWLPALAALLGLPFDAALPTSMQRGLPRNARAILAGRGSLAGVRALLEALFGRRPFRIFDRTEQFAPIALSYGSRLPAFLTGASIRAPKLNARLVLGRTALCPVDPVEETVSRGPELLVVVPASAAEVRRAGAAVQRLIQEMLPAGVRLRLRWTDLASAGAAPGDDVLAIVGDRPAARLGATALGRTHIRAKTRARLREGGDPAERRLP